MSYLRNYPLAWLRFIFTRKGKRSICNSNSVLPLDTESQSEIKPDENSVRSLNGSHKSTSGTHEASSETSLELSPVFRHTVIEIPESERGDGGGSGDVRERVVPGKDPFIVPEEESDGDGSALGGNETKPSEYLRMYYDLMYYTGFCTYRAARHSSVKKPIWVFVIGLFQKTIFWSLALLSAFHSICMTKYFLLQFLSQRDYYNGVSFAHHVACFMAKMYAVNLFAFKKHKTDAMLHEMEEYEKSENVGKNSSWKKKLVLMLLMTSITFAVAQTIVDCGEDGLVLESSHEFSQDLFIWHSKNFTNVSKTLHRKFAKNLTSTTITFASIVITRQVSAYMVLGIMFDLIVIVAAVVYAYVKAFIKDVKEVTANVPEENVDEWNRLQAKREVVWRKYRNVRSVCSAVNAVFDPLLKLMHGGNLLMFAFFMVICVFSDSTWVALLMYARDLVKVEVGYYVAGRIAESNDIIRAWLRNWALYTGKIKVGDKQLDLTAVLDELDKEPLGLGKGKFLIHHTFHFKFLGLVGSVFFSMADDVKNA